MGVSESYTYFVSGQGRVLATSNDEISLAVTDGATEAEVSLQVGLLFSNAVRDGTGLLNVSDYPNSQDFNGISEALNKLIEENADKLTPEFSAVVASVINRSETESGDASSDEEKKVLEKLQVVYKAVLKFSMKKSLK